MMNAAGAVINHLQQLEGLLGELLGLHRELLEAVQAKLAAMRGGDPQGMTACVTREGELIKRIHQCDGRRRQAMVEVGQVLGIDPRQAATMQMTQITGRIEGPQADRLDHIRKQLLACMTELGKVNTYCRLLAERMLSCHRALFEEATRGTPSQVVYDLGGKNKPSVAAQVLDATV